MAVSKEFIEAINEKNVLRIRLMLKNSLLLDTSFRSFWEMVRVAQSNGIEVWMEDSGQPLKRKPGPWTVDDMNYEITAVVNDFTEEHMRYLMDIIGEVYQTSASMENQDTTQQHLRQPVQEDSSKQRILNSKKEEFYVEILRQLSSMTSSIREKRYDNTRNLSTKDIENIMWTDGLIDEIRRKAQCIVNSCDEVQRR